MTHETGHTIANVEAISIAPHHQRASKNICTFLFGTETLITQYPKKLLRNYNQREKFHINFSYFYFKY